MRKWVKAVAIHGFRIPKRRVPAILHKAPSSFGAVTLGRKYILWFLPFFLCVPHFWSFTSLELKKSYIKTPNWRLPRLPLELRVLEAGDHDASASARGAEVGAAGSWGETDQKIFGVGMPHLCRHYCWWFGNPANQLRLVVYSIPLFTGFHTSQVVFSPDFWSINSNAFLCLPGKEVMIYVLVMDRKEPKPWGKDIWQNLKIHLLSICDLKDLGRLEGGVVRVDLLNNNNSQHLG